jgi:hypothetical protein
MTGVWVVVVPLADVPADVPAVETVVPTLPVFCTTVSNKGKTVV